MANSQDKFNLSSGFIEPAQLSLSPNFDDRPDEDDIDLLVIHAISLPPGKFGGPFVDQLFHNQLDVNYDPFFKTISELQVSAHLFIRRSGELYQYVDLNKRAFHAGESEFEGRRRCNDFSIGIELEGSDFEPFEDIQYEVLANLTATICGEYQKITPNRIVGHSDISPGRKTDPGPYFDWQRYRSLVPTP